MKPVTAEGAATYLEEMYHADPDVAAQLRDFAGFIRAQDAAISVLMRLAHDFEDVLTDDELAAVAALDGETEAT